MRLYDSVNTTRYLKTTRFSMTRGRFSDVVWYVFPGCSVDSPISALHYHKEREGKGRKKEEVKKSSRECND